jgi:hypothetical protein
MTFPSRASAVLAALAVVLPAAASAQVQPEVLRVLGRSGELVPGWSFELVWHDEAVTPGARVRLDGPSGSALLAVTAPQSDKGTPSCLVRSRSLCAELADAPAPVVADPAFRGALDAFGRRLVLADLRPRITGPGRLPEANRWLLVGLALFALAASAVVAARHARAAPPPARFVAGLAGLFALALVVRVVFVPWGPRHEYFHCAEMLWGLFDHGVSLYGDTARALFRAADRAFGGQERAIYATDAVLASLTVVATAMLDFALFRRWGRALFAGLVLCLLPQHLRYSGAEDAVIAAALFTAWAMVLVLAYVERPDTLTMLAAVAATTLAMQSRQETRVVPVLAVLLVLLARPRGDWKALLAPRALAGGALLTGLFVAQAILVPPLSIEGAIYRFDQLGRQVFFDAAVTPWPLWLLWGAGVAWGAWRARGPTLWAVVAGAALAGVPMAFCGNALCAMRTQIPSTPLYAIVTAGAAAAVLELRGRLPRLAPVLAAALVAVPIATAASRTAFVSSTTLPVAEWEFQASAVPGLPDGPGAVLFVPRDRIRFPEDLVWREGRLLNLLDVRDLAAGELPPGARPVLVYLGLYCRVWTGDETVTGPERDECAAVERRFALRPVAVRRLAGALDPGLQTHGPVVDGIEVGFYEVVGLRPAEAVEPGPGVVGADRVREGPKAGERVDRAGPDPVQLR